VVDELDLSIAPALVGEEHRLLSGLRGAVRLDLQQVLEEDGTLFARYALDTPGAR
jgi:5-amino-6-(5-phosphoribosylamino)uracil reductase